MNNEPNLPQGVLKLDHLEFPSPQSNPAFDAAVLRVQYALRDRMVQIKIQGRQAKTPVDTDDQPGGNQNIEINIEETGLLEM